jgi:hypothetical protein
MFKSAEPTLALRESRSHPGMHPDIPITQCFVRRVRTIDVQVRQLGGDSVKITIDAVTPTVMEATTEISQSQWTAQVQTLRQNSFCNLRGNVFFRPDVCRY